MVAVARTVARQRLSDQVVAHLREMIVEGEIAAGETLPPERELARQFGVSGTVIREALNALSARGLVEIRHGVGSFVTTPDHWHTTEPMPRASAAAAPTCCTFWRYAPPWRSS